MQTSGRRLTLSTLILVAGALLLPSGRSGAEEIAAGAAEEEAAAGVPDLRLVGWAVDDSTEGNGDLGLHPGEGAFLVLVLANFGSETARNVAATLSEAGDHPDVVVLDKFAVWPDVPATGVPVSSAVPHFRLRVAGTRPCSWEIPLELEITALGGYAVTRSLVLELRDQPVIDLAAQSGRPALYGADSNDGLGGDVAAGDLDGDGFDDLIAVAGGGDGPGNVGNGRGEVLVAYGSAQRRADVQLLAGLPAAAGLIFGVDDLDQLGRLAVGDLDGDGYDDLILGSRFTEGSGNGFTDAGEVAVIYGGATRITALDLSTGPAGVPFIYGADAGDNLGVDVEAADVNGDGFDDLILGALLADGPGNARSGAGAVVVIPGGPVRLFTINLSSPPASATIIHGAVVGDRLGSQVAAGDVDGDGIQDIIAGADQADGPGGTRNGAGQGVVVYGDPSLPADIDLLAPAVPVTIIHGIDPGDNLGSFINGASPLASGDLDGDGRDDVILGSRPADGPGNLRSFGGETAIFYGRGDRPAVVDLAVPSDDVHFIYGAADGDVAGESVSAADLNGDGLDDLILTAAGGENPFATGFSHGHVYVVPGRAGRRPDLDLLVPQPDVTLILGRSNSDEIRQAAAGDLDGDGIQDLLIGIANGDGTPAFPTGQGGEVLILPGGPRGGYRHDPDSFAFIDATLGTDLGLTCDDCSATVPIGFEFDFYGVKHEEVTVSSNGYLTFGGPGDLPAGFCTPTSNVPNDLIAVFWDDLDPSEGGTVHALAEGVSPDRRLTIQWTGVPLFGGIGDATFQVTLFETSDQILMQYQDVTFGDAADSGGTAVAGVESGTGLAGTALSCFSPGLAGASAHRWRRFASPTRIFLEDVETGAPAWTGTGLWHVVTDPTCSVAARSGTMGFYYGQDGTCDYDTGVANAGTLTSPAVRGLPQDAALSFWHRRQTEGSQAFDTGHIQVQADGGGFVPMRQVTENGNAWRFTGDFLAPQPQAGEFAGVDLSGFAGQDVEIRFAFDTIDDLNNDLLGWMVDDVAIHACPVFNSVSMGVDGVGVHAVATASPATLCETLSGSVDAAGSYCTACAGGLNYQWSQGGVPIPGATGVAHTVPASPPGMASFSVEIACPTNPLCAATSAPATVTSVAQPEAVEATLTVERAGLDLEFHWTDVGGADDYGLFSSLAADGAFTTLAGVSGSGAAGITIPTPAANLVYYLVAGRNAVCGAGPKNNFRTP